MSLDDKLREILKTPHQDSLGATVMSFPTSKLIAQIKQAFADEGYTTIDKRRYRDEYGREYLQYTFKDGFVRVPQFELMTGQEWYERFEKELNPEGIKVSPGMTVKLELSGVMEAAKRAAGIEEGEHIDG